MVGLYRLGRLVEHTYDTLRMIASIDLTLDSR